MTLEQERYFEHDADIGVIGRGASVERAFEDAAAATFAIMTDPARVREAQTVRIEFDEADVELALVTWLNLLIGEARGHGVVFSRFRLQHEGSHWFGEASGGAWRPELERGVEVKGATLTMLSVKDVDGAWEARCVVDV